MFLYFQTSLAQELSQTVGGNESQVLELASEVEQLTSELEQMQTTLHQLRHDKEVLEAKLKQRDENLIQVKG